jgi:hypothetical protein
MTSIERELAASAPPELGELARAAVIEACTAQWGR